MPEGHTLFRLARDLTDAFAGRVVRVSSPQGRFADAAALLDGSVLEGAQSWGKHLFLGFAGDRWVHVHLGLIGTFAVHTHLQEVPPPRGQVRLRITSVTDEPRGAEMSISYADLRGAITCALLTAAERDAVTAKGGPDPLRADADPRVAWRRISRSKQPIGQLLMDQTVLSGVGNVYRAEVLFRHRIHPLRAGNTLRVGQWEAIWADLVELLHEGVRTGRIDTVRPEHTPEAMGRPRRRDDHGGEVYVYRRTGQPCHVCERTVRTAELAGRNVFWCPRCQPVFRSRAIV